MVETVVAEVLEMVRGNGGRELGSWNVGCAMRIFGETSGEEWRGMKDEHNDENV